MNVVDLGKCRDLMRDWERVRQAILSGEVNGGALCVKDKRGGETIFLFGTYKTDSAGALAAGMRMSWELTRANDRPMLAANP